MDFATESLVMAFSFFLQTTIFNVFKGRLDYEFRDMIVFLEDCLEQSALALSFALV